MSEGLSLFGYLFFAAMGSLIVMLAVKSWKPKTQNNSNKKFNFDPNTGKRLI